MRGDWGRLCGGKQIAGLDMYRNMHLQRTCTISSFQFTLKESVPLLTSYPILKSSSCSHSHGCQTPSSWSKMTASQLPCTHGRVPQGFFYKISIRFLLYRCHFSSRQASSEWLCARISLEPFTFYHSRSTVHSDEPPT